MHYRIAAGIVTCNRKEAVLMAIESVYSQDVDIEVIVVDNASTDGTAAAIRERYPLVKLICMPYNTGCPGGRNISFANCTADYIINLDDDGCLDKEAARKVIETFDADLRIGIIALKQQYTDTVNSYRAIKQHNDEVYAFYGGVSAFRCSMLKQIGDYPDDFFLYHEEAVLALRAIDAGYRIVSKHDIIMYHPKVGGSAAKTNDYLSFRNALLVVTRLFPGWLMVKYLFLRICSYALISLRNGTFHKYLLAVAFVLGTLPQTLWTRKPCRKETVKNYFKFR